jgi:Txe/YoeB family toxin of Txe-Axe toxin-antitoxin module
MNAEAIRAVENIALVMVGWLLSVLTTELKEYRNKEMEKRKLFTRLWLILENIYINLEIAPPWPKASAAKDTEGAPDIEESWQKTVPPAPPLLPKDFDSVLERVVEWESESGQNMFIKQLNSIRSRLELSQQLYKELTLQETHEDEPMAHRALTSYADLITDLKQDTFKTLKLTSPLRFRLSQRWKRRIGSGE